MERKCRACGNIQASEDKYCSACGAPCGEGQDEQPRGADPSSGKPPRAANKKTLLTIAYATGGLFLLVVVAVLFAPEEDDPMASPAPTEAPVKATPTPPPARPTMISRPSNYTYAPACPTTIEAAYLDALDGHMRSFGAQIGLLSDRWLEAADNPLLMYDDVFVIGRETDLKVLMLTVDRMIDLSPPPSAARIDRMVEGTMPKTRAALGLMHDSMNPFDLDLFIRGNDDMQATIPEVTVIRAAMGVDVFCAS